MYIYVFGVLSCFGDSSCIHVRNFTNNEIPSADVNSLQYSTVTANTVDCATFFSCANSIFQSITFINARGPHSLNNAIITSGNANLTTLRMEGYFTGVNATFICQKGHFCFIDCYGTGCYGLNLLCSHKHSEGKLFLIASTRLRHASFSWFTTMTSHNHLRTP